MKAPEGLTNAVEAERFRFLAKGERGSASAPRPKVRGLAGVLMPGEKGVSMGAA
jgi:hypothetical protein